MAVVLLDLKRAFETVDRALLVRKTKAVLFTSNNVYNKFLELNHKFIIEGGEIEVGNEIKYLGIINDIKIKFTEHVEYVCVKNSKKIAKKSE